MSIDAVGATSVASGLPVAEKKHDSPAKIAEAARQFEALLIGQILKEFAGSNQSALFSDDQSNSAVLEMGNEQLAQSLAASGGLGIARLVTHGLKADDSR